MDAALHHQHLRLMLACELARYQVALVGSRGATTERGGTTREHTSIVGETRIAVTADLPHTPPNANSLTQLS